MGAIHFTPLQEGEILGCCFSCRILPLNTNCGGINAKATAQVLDSIGKTSLTLTPGGIYLVPAESEAQIILAGVRLENNQELVSDFIHALEEAEKIINCLTEAAIVMPRSCLNRARELLHIALAGCPWDIHLFEA